MSSISEFRVRYAETDQMGVAYHANYLVWCEIGRTDFIRQLGLSYSQMEREGMLLAVSEANVRFHASARYDELVRVETSLASVRSRSLTFDYLISQADTGVRLATARISLISIKAGGRPVAMPPAMRALLESASR